MPGPVDARPSGSHTGAGLHRNMAGPEVGGDRSCIVAAPCIAAAPRIAAHGPQPPDRARGRCGRRAGFPPRRCRSAAEIASISSPRRRVWWPRSRWPARPCTCWPPAGRRCGCAASRSCPSLRFPCRRRNRRRRRSSSVGIGRAGPAARCGDPGRAWAVAVADAGRCGQRGPGLDAGRPVAHQRLAGVSGARHPAAAAPGLRTVNAARNSRIAPCNCSG
jgi:hypothetical protein